jgi:hypothetical protein
VKSALVESSNVEAAARKTSMKAAAAEASSTQTTSAGETSAAVEATAAVEAPTTKSSTAMEAATAAHAASACTAAATSVTAAAATATSECRSWLNQADRRQCEQGYNRFAQHAFPPLDEVALFGPKTLSQRDYSTIRQRSR